VRHATKAAVHREAVYSFAWKAIEAGHPEPAAAAVIAFEWLQRPENIIGGHVTWPGYRGAAAPDQIRILHHKTGAVVLHPLSDPTTGELFYADAEAVLARLPRRGVPMVLRPNGQLYSVHRMGQVVRELADRFGLPGFTIDACRHGGMTELEEAELTDGQGRALSGHSSDAYKRYAKRTAKRALAATRRRHAHRMADTAGTGIQNEPQSDIQNGLAAKR